MHACLLEIHGIRGSALVTCLGTRVFRSRPSRLSHSTTPAPGSRPRLGGRQRVILGRIVDLAASLGGGPGMAAASPSFGCRWAFRSCLSQGHPRERSCPVVTRSCCSSSSLQLFLCCYSASNWSTSDTGADCYQCLPLPAVSRGGLGPLWPAALWAQHILSLISTAGCRAALGDGWRDQPVFQQQRAL